MLLFGYFGGHGLIVVGLVLLAAIAGFVLCSLFGEQLDEIAKDDLAEVDEKALASRGMIAQFISKEEAAIQAKISAARVNALAEVDELLSKFLGSRHPARAAVVEMRAAAAIDTLAPPRVIDSPASPPATNCTTPSGHQ